MQPRHSIADLQILLHKAQNKSGSKMTECLVLYRNKPKPYFNRLDNGDGRYEIMLPYVKDNSGDQKSPINGRLNGLFFSASVDISSSGNKPRSQSAFGDTRIHVPINLIADGTNLYFTDFYCMQDTRYHYTTLIMSKPGTPEDKFCKSNLLQLHYEDNVFFKRIFNNDINTYTVNADRFLLVEVFSTEPLDINNVIANGGMIENNVSTFGKGRSSINGLPKNTSCRECNINPTQMPSNSYRKRKVSESKDDCDEDGNRIISFCIGMKEVSINIGPPKKKKYRAQHY